MHLQARTLTCGCDLERRAGMDMSNATPLKLRELLSSSLLPATSAAAAGAGQGPRGVPRGLGPSSAASAARAAQPRAAYMHASRLDVAALMITTKYFVKGGEGRGGRVHE